MKLLAFLLALLFASPAAAWIHGASNSSCPFGAGLPDGCVGAPTNAAFLAATYFSAASFSVHARQSSQTWTSSHPWTWNSPGVDYAVGYSTSTPLVDPTTASSSGAGSYGVLPGVCSYQPATVAYPRVYCHNVSGPTAILLEGFEFGPVNGHGCTVLEISGAGTPTTVTVENNDFKNGSSAGVWACAPNATGNYLLKVDAGPVTLNVIANLFDEEYATANGNVFVSTISNNSNGGDQTLQYNAILNASSLPLTGTTPGNTVMAYNYFDGWVLGSTAGVGQHGEIYVHEAAGTPTIALASYTYNTTVQQNTSNASTNTTTFYFNGVNGQFYNFTSVVADHNVVVNNCPTGTTWGGSSCTGGAATNSAGLEEFAYAQKFASATVTNNFVDIAGALFCELNLGGTAAIHGSIADNGDGTSTLTATSVSPTAIYAGGGFHATGVTGNPIVSAYGTAGSTGTGGTGTYILATSQTVASFTNGQMTSSFIASLTDAGNVSLNSGNTIHGFAVSVGSAGCN